MKAPEKLYFGESDKGILEIYSNRESNDEIEYTRTDVFIDKACDWIEDHSYDYLEFGEAGFGADFHYPKMIEDFRKAMKGE